MLSLSPLKLMIVLAVAIVLLGPDKLPQFARQLGSAWRSFQQLRDRMESEIRNNLPDLPSTDDLARLARSPVAILNHLAEMPSYSIQSTKNLPTSEIDPASAEILGGAGSLGETGSLGGAGSLGEAERVLDKSLQDVNIWGRFDPNMN